jgi:hypothetical protein
MHILFSEQFKDLEGGLGKHVFLFGELRVLENLFKRLQTRLASCTVLHAYTQDIPGISTLAISHVLMWVKVRHVTFLTCGSGRLMSLMSWRFLLPNWDCPANNHLTSLETKDVNTYILPPTNRTCD